MSSSDSTGDTQNAEDLRNDSQNQQLECRVCRGDEESGKLYRPCKCLGSIGYVHTECLIEWLDHSGRDSCEVCKTKYKFTKAYSIDKPTGFHTLLGSWLATVGLIPYFIVRISSLTVWIVSAGGGGGACWR